MPTAKLCRRPFSRPAKNGVCADGPDFWPSAQILAVGVSRLSRSEGNTSLKSNLCMHGFFSTLQSVVPSFGLCCFRNGTREKRRHVFCFSIFPFPVAHLLHQLGLENFIYLAKKFYMLVYYATLSPFGWNESDLSHSFRRLAYCQQDKRSGDFSLFFYLECSILR